ncbi:LPXTG cell wall anchor domain-containing protein [Actinoplanes sp. NPDC051494]|uniref:LPXTG cell wall anchor domain-containing protein n=1 Tax=Actinoplanes sp. NPDC051494 TaxID=3363907 RepID=UPI00379672DC
MNLFKSPLRRTTALAAGAFIGLAGAFAVTGPASAHAPEVKGSTSCIADGKWTVNWAAGNDWRTEGTIDAVDVSTSAGVDKTAQDKNKYNGGWNKPGKGGNNGGDGNVVWTPTTAGEIAPGAKVDPNYANPKKGSTEFAATDTVAALRVHMTWTDGASASRIAVVSKPAECVVVPPSPSSPSPSPSTSTEASPTPSASTSTSASPTPSASASTSPTPTPSETTPVIGDATPIFEINCDSVTLGLDNPADGVEIPLVLEPSKGDKQTLVVKPGEKKSATFEASEGFTVKIYVEGFEDDSETVAWEAPEGCDTAGSGGGEDEGDSLPLTGAAAGSIAAGAGVLLAGGLALFFVARRRKVKFTA